MIIPESMQPFLNGAFGSLVAEICQALVTLGQIKGAKRMVPIASAHTSTMIYSSSRDEGQDFIEELADSGVRFKVPTSVDPVSIDIEDYMNINISENYAQAQMRSVTAFSRLGGMGTYTCTPWNSGNSPRPGDHLAWVDSSAVIYANSVMAARTNRNTDPTALAAAITGYIPECGLHLAENRLADIAIRVEAPLRNVSDFGALGAYVAKKFGPKVYVFCGLEDYRMTNEIYHHLGPALATWGNVALYHVVGKTPEATTLDRIWSPRADRQEFNFGIKELTEFYDQFTPTLQGNQFVILGCPHCTITEVRNIAEALKGHKIKTNHELWVLTDRPTKHQARRDGLLDHIENAGGKIISEMCWVLSANTNDIIVKYDTICTDSSKAALFSNSLGKPTFVKDRDVCIKDILV